MKGVIVILFLTVLMFGANLEQLQQEKNEYKQSKKSLKKVSKDEVSNKVIIVFNNSVQKEQLQQFAKDYNLTYNLCLTNTICIFKLKEDSIISKIKQNENIADVMEYKKHTFKEY